MKEFVQTTVVKVRVLVNALPDICVKLTPLSLLISAFIDPTNALDAAIEKEYSILYTPIVGQVKSL